MTRMRGTVAGALTGMAMLVGACGDEPRPIVAPEAHAPDVVPASLLSMEWNYYTGQEAIYSTGGYAGFDRPDSYRSMTYTVQRTLQPDSTWTTVMLFDPQLPFGPIPTDDQYRYDVARVETNSAHSFFRMYDRSGALIDTDYASPTGDVVNQGDPQIIPPNASPMPTWPDLSERVPATTPDPCPDPTQISCPVQMRTGAGATIERDPRQWIDQVIVTTASRQRMDAGLEREFGKPSGKVGARERYIHARGRVQLEVLVDPKLGAIVEENQAVDGELKAHVTYRYSQLEPGVLLRSGSRIEIAPTRPGEQPRVIYTELSNVKVGKIATGGAR